MPTTSGHHRRISHKCLSASVSQAPGVRRPEQIVQGAWTTEACDACAASGSGNEVVDWLDFGVVVIGVVIIGGVSAASWRRCEHGRTIEVGADLVLMHGGREEVALAERAPEVLQRGELLVVLDPLGDRAQTELVPDPYDRARQARFLRRAEQLDERAIDLEDVDGEAVEVAQRGVAGAEVVDRQRDAELAQ